MNDFTQHQSAGSKQDGIGLIEAVLVIGIFAIVVMGFGRLQMTAKLAKRQAVQTGQAQDLAHYIRQRIDCAETAIQPQCATDPSAIVEAKACDGSILLEQKAPFSEIVNWRVRAKCGTSIGSNRLVLEYQAINSDADTWKPMNRGIPVVCGGGPVAKGPLRKAVAGGGFTCGVINSRVHCVGVNYNGVLGDLAAVPPYQSAPESTTVMPETPVDSKHMVRCFSPIKGLPNLEPDQIFAGPENVCAKYGAELWCWGNDFASRVTGGVNLEGTHGDSLELSAEAYASQPTRFGWTQAPVKEIVHAGEQVSCVVLENGRAQCWGRGGRGALGTQQSLVITTTNLHYGDPCTVWGTQYGMQCRYPDSHILLPSQNYAGHVSSYDWTGAGPHYPNFGLAVTKIASSGKHTCMLDSGGVACWGLHADGQLGDPITVAGYNYFPYADSRHFNAPVLAIPPPALAAHRVTDIAVGDRHTCAVARGGVRCWGDNSKRQLGRVHHLTPDRPSYDVLDLSPGAGVTAIAAAGDRTCVIANGAVKCWGDLWNGLTTAIPTQIEGLESGVTSINMGWGGHACAERDGQSYCWGMNDWGQLGTGENGYEFGRHVMHAVAPRCDGSANSGGSGGAGEPVHVIRQCGQRQ